MEKYYSLKNILKLKAHYNVIIGERSNGKTYACLYHGLKNYIEKGEQFAILRRWREDLQAKRSMAMFTALSDNGVITALSKGEWNSIYYYSGRWYLQRYDLETDKVVRDENPFAYAFAITQMEHDKSTSYPNVKTIIFDEFLTRSSYLPEEFMMFMNTLSTIIRQRNDVTIFMLGNTVTKYCPYFKEMGLTHVKDMKQGAIDVYNYGETQLKVAVEFCKSNEEGKQSDTYFSFDNPKLKMITGGVWELDIYPHCPIKYAPKNILFRFYIKFDDETLECEIVVKEDYRFIFVHPKTSELKEKDDDLIYTQDYIPKTNHRRNITMPITNLEKKILATIRHERIFFSDNETGERFTRYLEWCNQ